MKFNVDAVIFDLDGTLIDSAEIYFKLMERACARVGLPVPSRETILEVTRSAKADFRRILPDRIACRKDELLAQVVRKTKEMFPSALRDNLNIICRVPSLIRGIHLAGIKVGVATSTKARYLDLKLVPLKKAGVAGFIDSIICIEDSSRAKPEPDPLIKCAAMLGVKPRDCLYVGDSYVDIRAGKAAGMKTVGVLTGIDNCERLKEENPDIIIKSAPGLLRYLPNIGE